jgi:hypothetical protein
MLNKRIKMCQVNSVKCEEEAPKCIECKVNTAAKKEYGKECYEDNDWNNGWWTMCDECFDKQCDEDENA